MATTYYIPRNVSQFDGSRFAALNCTMASGSTLLDRHTLGKKLCTGAKMRAHQYDQSGGTDLMDLHTAWSRGHGESLDVRLKIPWNDLVVMVKGGKAMVLQVWYGYLGSYRWQTNFSGNHAIEINQIGTMRNSAGVTVAAGLMLDPLASGRRRWVPLSVLRRGAGWLHITSTRVVGLGYAYAGLSRRIGKYTTTTTTPPPGSVPTLVLTKPPAPAEVSPMINASGLVITSSHRMRLKKGQPVYRTPGGAIATKMSNDAGVDYYGRAGGGWNCVEVLTGAAYKDGVNRPTLVYVPATAGPIYKK